jgi:hypothetical protein
MAPAVFVFFGMVTALKRVMVWQSGELTLCSIHLLL